MPVKATMTREVHVTFEDTFPHTEDFTLNMLNIPIFKGIYNCI